MYFSVCLCECQAVELYKCHNSSVKVSKKIFNMLFVIQWYFKIYKKAMLTKLELNYLIIFSVTMLDVKNRQKSEYL